MNNVLQPKDNEGLKLEDLGDNVFPNIYILPITHYSCDQCEYKTMKKSL